MEVMDFWPG